MKYVPVATLKKYAATIVSDYDPVVGAVNEAKCTARIYVDGRWVSLSKRQRERLVVEVGKLLGGY